jgi:hypothetical protein
MDITTSTGDFSAQGIKYRDIMHKILAYKESVTAFIVWGLQDNYSWRGDRNPTLFDANGDRKPAYDELYFLASGTYPPPLPEVEPDENGYYYYNTFEDGTTQFWTSRGNTNVVNSSNYAYEGTKSIFVSGRTADWNGTARVIDGKIFKPGDTYSFGAVAMFADGAETGNFKLTLQYTVAGTTNYASVAETSAKKGEWVQLVNSNYTIPANATGMLLYVEMPGLLVDFYVDKAFGGIAGKDGATANPHILSANSLKAWTNGNQLHITGAAAGKPWQIYNLTGTLIQQGIASGGTTTVPIIFPRGIYIVRSENFSVKVINKY